MSKRKPKKTMKAKAVPHWVAVERDFICTHTKLEQGGILATFAPVVLKTRANIEANHPTLFEVKFMLRENEIATLGRKYRISVAEDFDA